MFILGLSKWVRQLVKHHDSFTSAIQSLVSFSQSRQGEVESHTEELAQTNPESPRTPSSALQSAPELPKLHQCLSPEGQITVPSVSHPLEAGTWSHSNLQSFILLTKRKSFYF